MWILNLYRTVGRPGGKYAGGDEQKRIFLGDQFSGRYCLHYSGEGEGGGGYLARVRALAERAKIIFPIFFFQKRARREISPCRFARLVLKVLRVVSRRSPLPCRDNTRFVRYGIRAEDINKYETGNRA